VHVSLADNGDEGADGVRLEHIIKGDTVREVLKYVEFDPEALMGKLRADVEAAVNANRMEDQQAGRLLKFYEEALMGYTYLEDPNAD
jgi:arginine decarboxylase